MLMIYWIVILKRESKKEIEDIEELEDFLSEDKMFKKDLD